MVVIGNMVLSTYDDCSSSSSGCGVGGIGPAVFYYSKLSIKIYKIIKRHPNITLVKIARKTKKDAADRELNACIKSLCKHGYIKNNSENGFIITKKEFENKFTV